MNSLFNKPIHIANFPAAADRSSLLLTSHQYHYLSPPLTPFPYYPFPSDQAELARSPRSNNGQSLPGLREMLPQQGHEALSTTDPEAHAYSPSAQQRHHERFIKESNEHNSSSIARGLQHLQDPTRIVPLYANPPPPIVQTTSIVSPLLRRNKAHVASACVNCKKAHLACDANRPCRRCVSLDKQDTCVDVQHKRRGRPRLKDTAPTIGGHQSQRRPSYLHRHVSHDDSRKYHISSSNSSSAPYPRESIRRDYQHHRSFSQGSQSNNPQHHPYAHPTPPTSAGYPTHNVMRNLPGYYELASPPLPPNYPGQHAPNSPNYYPPHQPQLTGQPQRDSFPPHRSPYQATSTVPKEIPRSPPPDRSHHLLQVAEQRHPGVLRRGSFPASFHQSETGQQRPALHRSGSASGADSRHVLNEQAEGSDRLPSLKDLGVPFH